MPSLSAYSLKKLAITYLQQFVAAECPDVCGVALHPGNVRTAMTPMGVEHLAVDPPALAGGVAVWLATDASPFMSRRYVDAHWSVDELMARRAEIEEQDKPLTGLNTKLGLDRA